MNPRCDIETSVAFSRNVLKILHYKFVVQIFFKGRPRRCWGRLCQKRHTDIGTVENVTKNFGLATGTQQKYFRIKLPVISLNCIINT